VRRATRPIPRSQLSISARTPRLIASGDIPEHWRSQRPLRLRHTPAEVTSFEWFALGCGLVGLLTALAIGFGGWRPRSRLVIYPLFAAVGLAVGTGLTALALASFPLFLGLLIVYFGGRWILGRRVL
jgi:hypothetical protein